MPAKTPSKPAAVHRKVILDATGRPFDGEVTIDRPHTVTTPPSPKSPRETPQPVSELVKEFNGPPRWAAMIQRAPFHIAKLKPACSIDRVTRRWIRNANDERAAQEGCRFDEARGQFVVDWMQEYCYLYEGDKAGLPMDIEDWQYEWDMQVYGWVRYSEERGRWIRRFRRANAWIPKKNAKALALDTPIPTLHGWKAMGDLVVGDTLFDEQGKPCSVLAVSETFHDPCYRVTFCDRSSIVASGNHLWRVESYTSNYKPRIRTTEELARNCTLYRKATGAPWASNHRIPAFCGRYRYVISIERVETVPTRCIKVDSPSELFLAGTSMVATHNSPTLAANGLYLLCGDGEYGQKCYSIAKDSKQGLISHTHAMEMVRFSEPLSKECQIYMTNYDIFHKPTRSKYILVSSENAKLGSAEGYNGSLLVDEVHVVDHKIMDRVKRAGISRSEPLHIEMSTAGDSGDGYGYERYEHCMRLLSGELYDPEHYVLNYSIPNDTPIEKLYDEKTVVALGQECNPSMGRIILLSEFKSDWRQSVGSQTELNKFAMYRLNRWMSASANWIAYPDWMACKAPRKYDLAELAEFPCFGGLDLSKTRDMTALALLFALPDDDLGVRPYLHLEFWLPERTAAMYANKIDFHKDTFRPYLTIVKGRTIDYDMLAKRLDDLVENFDLRTIGYDPYNSDTLMDILYNDYGWSEDQMVAVRQNMPNMAPPTADTERLILNQHLMHEDNAVLNWQMSHVAVQEDKNGNKKPMKPEGQDYRKIDGVIAMIMAVAMMLDDPTIRSEYHGFDSIALFPPSDDTTGKTAKVKARRSG